jgi:hypothetical protein
VFVLSLKGGCCPSTYGCGSRDWAGVGGKGGAVSHGAPGADGVANLREEEQYDEGEGMQGVKARDDLL